MRRLQGNIVAVYAWRTVDVLVRDAATTRSRKHNDPLRNVRGHGLPFLVMRDVSLGHADGAGHFCLCDPYAGSYVGY